VAQGVSLEFKPQYSKKKKKKEIASIASLQSNWKSLNLSEPLDYL
jgi:hypothetical protein